MKNAHKLKSFFDSALKSEEDVIITRDQNGIYKLFSKYSIKDNGVGIFQVRYAKSNYNYTFSSLKIAMAWCTLHNEGMIIESNRINDLDMKLCSVDFDIAVHKKMAKTPKNSKTLIYITKLQEDNNRRRNILKEIDIYINSSKKIQARKFNKPNKY